MFFIKPKSKVEPKTYTSLIINTENVKKGKNLERDRKKVPQKVRKETVINIIIVTVYLIYYVSLFFYISLN